MLGLDFTLIYVKKGYRSLIGKDVVQLLKHAIDARGDIKVEVAAILNDTTGCLMSCAWKNPKCRIGLIIGTGTNACYLEDIDQVIFSSNYFMDCIYYQCNNEII